MAGAKRAGLLHDYVMEIDTSKSGVLDPSKSIIVLIYTVRGTRGRVPHFFVTINKIIESIHGMVEPSKWQE